MTRPRPTALSCSIEGCDKPSSVRGWCQMHYVRWQRHGDPTISHTRKGWSVEERFAASYEVLDNGCWSWTGTLRGYGYGGFTVAGKPHRAHRWAYEQFVGPIPAGLQLDHTCHDPATCNEGEACPHRRCVNPAHLEPVTQTENARRGNAGRANREKTHCAQGHEFTPENTFFSLSGPYRNRACRECYRLRSLAAYRSDPAAANARKRAWRAARRVQGRVSQ